MKKDFYFPSGDGTTTIHAISWAPEGKMAGILQICHGMAEHIKRYHDFAEYMTQRGLFVIGHDHLGHGESVVGEEDDGYFHEEKGNQYVIEDIHKVREMAQKENPGIPYFMLGHSMGSFLLRQYLTEYSSGLSGAIIMGSGIKGPLILRAGMMLCKMTAAVKGWRYRSELIENLSVGGNNRKFEPSDTPKDWLTSDIEKCREYIHDTRCGFVFTVAGYYQMFSGMKILTKEKNIRKMERGLPIFIVSGEEDPVGNFGRGVMKIYDQFKHAGMEKVRVKLYKGDRHEILNEKDRLQVYADLYQWIRSEI